MFSLHRMLNELGSGSSRWYLDKHYHGDDRLPSGGVTMVVVVGR